MLFDLGSPHFAAQGRSPMSAGLDQVDLAKNLVALAKVLDDVILRKLREYAAGLITEWSTPEKADDLAAVLEETARQVRLCRPNHQPSGSHLQRP
ncbi:hypothetical protein [Actinokineospora xionganensis]|uniref:Tn3 transposase DDE domain-containing protein n=1 Tax=Actinokineospora xionganensis TaxID=2684470 RepID=A0ABR7LH37_9PSEU|nr:hypothetical protein [Actinokineospora xionganensis]MBC6451684.1 hypothetical protein [Actinokineospora xionganensis]